MMMLMVCISHPEFYLDPLCKLVCFRMVSLLRVVLTSSSSPLLYCFPHISVGVLSSTASVMIYSGQICMGCPSIGAYTFSPEAGYLSYLFYVSSNVRWGKQMQTA